MQTRTQRLSFDEWMNTVDGYLRAACGCDSRDLIDQCYADWYEDGVSAKTAARRALAAEYGD